MGDVCCCWILGVPEQHAMVVSEFGKFSKIIKSGAGIAFLNPFTQNVDAVVSLLLQTLKVSISTKTKDHTFMKISMDIQYRVLSDEQSIMASVYKLDNADAQMTAYVEDVLRSTVNQISFEDVYREKTKISEAVKQSLDQIMKDFGYEFVATPITDLSPENYQILDAMNKVLEFERKYAAQQQDNERIRNQIVMKAEAEKVAYCESGKGLAGKRAAIVDGLRESVSSFSKGMSGVTSKDVLEMILVTQYFDMLKDVSAKGKQNTIFLKHGPSAVSDITADIKQGFELANISADPKKKR